MIGNFVKQILERSCFQNCNPSKLLQSGRCLTGVLLLVSGFRATFGGPLLNVNHLLCYRLCVSFVQVIDCILNLYCIDLYFSLYNCIFLVIFSLRNRNSFHFISSKVSLVCNKCQLLSKTFLMLGKPLLYLVMISFFLIVYQKLFAIYIAYFGEMLFQYCLFVSSCLKIFFELG